ncbi:hypothetical protein [Methylosarcina fibrata]|uniref:hypothetical protein n=1 Tax=Methylosarcina fibrata TaxID=105972 RepID=UPI00035D5A53|nr:hypothetical protein [Methylosarcina fibrata]
MKLSGSPCSEPSIGVVLIALAGPLAVWALHFAVVYGLHPAFCLVIDGSRAGLWVQMAVIAATLAALTTLLLLMLKPEIVLPGPEDEPLSFLTGVMRLLSLLAFFGVTWAGSAAIFLPACRALA